MRRLGAVGGVLIVTAALALSACGGGNDSAAKANATASTLATTGQQGGSSGGATGGTTAGHRPATTKPQAATTSPHGATTSSAATTTTMLNTIKPLPGRPPPPVFDYNLGRISSASPITVNGTQYGVCRGPNHFTTVIVSWTTYNTDYVQLNGDHSTNYPADDTDVFMSVPCDANHGVGSDPRAYVHFTLFGPGGEATAAADIFVDRNYQP